MRHAGRAPAAASRGNRRMNPLLLLRPETAHAFAIWALRHGLAPAQDLDDPALAGELFGKPLRNPIGLAAGAEKEAAALAGWARLGFGLVEAGTVTLPPRAGNPRPRVWRVGERALVNWMGLPGRGLVPFVANLRAFAQDPARRRLLLGASIAAPAGDDGDFRRLAAACAPLVDYLVLNASCPNVGAHVGVDAESGASEGRAEPAATLEGQLAATLEGAGGVPVMVKLGPTRDGPALAMMVDAAVRGGAAGIVATNTVPYELRALLGPLAFDWPRHRGRPVGGYSGPALLEIAVWMVAECRRLLGPSMPILGVGGVQSGADAKRLLDAGADAIQLYTGLVYRGPGLLQEIARTVCDARPLGPVPS